jgi:hypothetical protein
VKDVAPGPEIGEGSAAFIRKQDQACAAIGMMTPAQDQPRALKEKQHGANGICIGAGKPHELLLGDALVLSEDREQDELIGGDAEGLKQRIGAAVHGPVGSAEGHGDVVSGNHDGVESVMCTY